MVFQWTQEEPVLVAQAYNPSYLGSGGSQYKARLWQTARETLSQKYPTQQKG
jgi:hypothetical protein